MSFSFDQVEGKFYQQLQIRILEVLTQQMNLDQKGITNYPFRSHVDHINNSIYGFHFDGLAGVTFELWFKKCEDIFNVDLVEFDYTAKVRVLQRKLGTNEHERYTDYVLPKNPRDPSFDATVVTLSQISGEQSSLSNIRYQCLKLAKAEDDKRMQV